MTEEQTADDEPVQVEEAVEEEADVVEAEAEAPAEAEAEAPVEVDAGSEDQEEATVDPAVQEFIGQDSTVVHNEPEGDGVIPTEFRTPPGIPSGLDPGTPEQRGSD